MSLESLTLLQGKDFDENSDKVIQFRSQEIEWCLVLN